jgi:DNA-binding NarL/FixJ family response regulator
VNFTDSCVTRYRVLDRLCCKCHRTTSAFKCVWCNHSRCGECWSIPRKVSLSPREAEVAEALGRGEKLTRIGKRLGISVKTVATHAARAAEKLELRDTNALRIRMVEQRLAAQGAP